MVENSVSLYFEGKLLQADGTTVLTDRLGSVRVQGTQRLKYYPYGEDRTGNPASGKEYATYYRDGNTGLDYANQRYYGSTVGRFLTPDPYMSGAKPSDPGSWNQFAYVEGDPVGYKDPTGQSISEAEGFCPAEFSTEECIGLGLLDSAGGGVIWGNGSVFNPCNVSHWRVPNPLCSTWLPILFDPGVKSPWVCPAQYQIWIDAHGADAAAVAGSIGTTEANILALSAYESGWGRGEFVVNGGNAFFSLQTTKPKEDSPDPPNFEYSTGWKTAREPLPNGKWAIVAKYANYLDSAKSFAYYKGSLFKNVKDPTSFGTIASLNGFGITVSTFVSIANTFIKCLQ